jgi:predicted alpha/beta-hydrolase family hydrolase
MEEPFVSSEVQGILHRPAEPNGRGIVLTHGAGSNKDAPVLVKIVRALEERGFTVLRYDLPFRRLRAHGSPNPSNAARDREGVRHAVAAMRGIVPGPIVAGGHSYGGRQTAMAAAEEPGLAVSSLVLFSYPLHPPGQPEKLRTAYFPDLRIPVLFVQGTKDPFGSPLELQVHLPLIPAATDVIEIAGAGHDLKRAPEFAQQIAERMLF